MAIDKEFLDLLRCPATRQPLTDAGETLVAELNRRIAEGRLTNVGGQQVDEPIDGALVREDSQVAYVIRDSIPEMLIESGIPLAGLDLG